MRIGIFGAGAVGGYVGGTMALAGEDVTLIGQWAQHVERVKLEGLRLTGTQGERVAHPKILHLHEVQSQWRNPFDVVFLCVKSYDTAWAATMMASYLRPDGFIVSMQNGMNEESIASVVGWDRTMGVVLNTIGVNNIGPGAILRTTRPGGAAHTVFRVGEPDGRASTRALEVVRMLKAVDSADITTNLMGERWSKLVTNSISHGLSGATGLSSRGLLGSGSLRKLTVKLAAEGIAVGQALDYLLVDIYGNAPSVWAAAALGRPEDVQAVERRLLDRMQRLTEDERPSVSQDILRGRRTEIEFTNGHIVAKGKALGIPTPTQDAVLAAVRRVENGEVTQSADNLAGIA